MAQFPFLAVDTRTNNVKTAKVTQLVVGGYYIASNGPQCYMDYDTPTFGPEVSGPHYISTILLGKKGIIPDAPSRMHHPDPIYLLVWPRILPLVSCSGVFESLKAKSAYNRWAKRHLTARMLRKMQENLGGSISAVPAS